jgi:hypothetical protein
MSCEICVMRQTLPAGLYGPSAARLRLVGCRGRRSHQITAEGLGEFWASAFQHAFASSGIYRPIDGPICSCWHASATHVPLGRLFGAGASEFSHRVADTRQRQQIRPARRCGVSGLQMRSAAGLDGNLVERRQIRAGRRGPKTDSGSKPLVRSAAIRHHLWTHREGPGWAVRGAPDRPTGCAHR